ncbi:hypothetical protein IT399_02355 [Candidatus Nomurabacteria bacterium]|nr:hypothetical protein [Candidatus Nomurabacteria bacterium]
MISKIRNIIIFVIIASVLILIYLYFIKSPGTQSNLVSSSSISLPNINGSTDQKTSTSSSITTVEAKDFLALLLNVKNIKLDDAIFTSVAFMSLRDSSITLVPDGNEGRPNPFAPFGNDVAPVAPNISSTPSTPATPTNP